MAQEKIKLELDEFEQEILLKMKRYADEKGYVLNPNIRIRNILIKGLARNYRRYGELYCPCRRVTGDPEKDKLIICPCKYHEDEIREMGRCHCGLFLRSEQH